VQHVTNKKTTTDSEVGHWWQLHKIMYVDISVLSNEFYIYIHTYVLFKCFTYVLLSYDSEIQHQRCKNLQRNE
jgi:hypothetical protein